MRVPLNSPPIGPLLAADSVEMGATWLRKVVSWAAVGRPAQGFGGGPFLSSSSASRNVAPVRNTALSRIDFLIVCCLRICSFWYFPAKDVGMGPGCSQLYFHSLSCGNVQNGSTQDHAVEHAHELLEGYLLRSKT